MKTNRIYTILLSMFLLATAGRTWGQVAELEDLYCTSIGSNPVTSLTNGGWYLICTNNTPSTCLRENDNGNGLTTYSTAPTALPTENSLATEKPMYQMLFKATSYNGGFRLMSGNGKYIYINNYGELSLSATNSTAISLYNNRGKTFLLYGNNRYITNTGGTSDKRNNNNLYLYKVTLKYKVTYNYTYKGEVKETYTAYCNEGETYPAFGAGLSNIYTLDKDNLPTLPEKVDKDNLNFEIPVLLVNKHVFTIVEGTEAYSGETLDLRKLIKSENPEDNTNVKYTFAITDDGKTGSKIDGGTFTAGNREGIVTLSVYAEEGTIDGDWYPKSELQEFQIKVIAMPAYIKNFIDTYNNLFHYHNVLGTMLGRYTFSVEGHALYNNEYYFRALAEYTSMYADIANQTEFRVKEATNNMQEVINMLEEKDKDGAYMNLSLNMPHPGVLLRIQNSATAGYITPSGEIAENNCAKKSTSINKANEASADNIFYYYEANGTGSGCSMLSYRNGLFMNLSSFESQLSEKTTAPDVITFGNADRTTTAGLYSVSGIAGKYTLEEVTKLPVTVNSHGWATLYTPTAMTIPGNVRAYVENGTPSDGKMPVRRIIGTVPPCTALLICAEEGIYNFTVAQGTADEPSPNTYLKGTFPLQDTMDGAMTLQPRTAGTGFYPWTKEKKPLITHFKAYYEAPATAGAKALILSFGDEEGTAILSHTENNAITDKDTYYDLHGRRINGRPASPGIYITGGRKVLIK